MSSVNHVVFDCKLITAAARWRRCPFKRVSHAMLSDEDEKPGKQNDKDHEVDPTRELLLARHDKRPRSCEIWSCELRCKYYLDFGVPSGLKGIFRQVQTEGLSV